MITVKRLNYLFVVLVLIFTYSCQSDVDRADSFRLQFTTEPLP